MNGPAPASRKEVGAGSFYALCVALVIATPLAAQANDTAGLAACRQVTEPAERLACYDRLADTASRTGAASSPTPARPPEPTRPVPTGTELFGKSPAAVAESVARASGVATPTSITSTVSALSVGPDNRVTLTLANGQAWRQVETETLYIRTGDTVTIRRAALGSFLLTSEGSRQSVRVKRLR